jgi:D-lactate dehydrogenase
MRILIYSSKDFEISYLEHANNKKHTLSFLEEALSSKTAIKATEFGV